MKIKDRMDELAAIVEGLKLSIRNLQNDYERLSDTIDNVALNLEDLKEDLDCE